MTARPPIILAMAATLAVGAPPAGPPKPAPAPAAPLALTRDERWMLLGFRGRELAVRLAAQRDVEAIAREQDEYLGGVAARLGLSPEALRDGYQIDLTTGAIAPRPKEASP